jgi:hypothetical protein
MMETLLLLLLLPTSINGARQQLFSRSTESFAHRNIEFDDAEQEFWRGTTSKTTSFGAWHTFVFLRKSAVWQGTRQKGIGFLFSGAWHTFVFLRKSAVWHGARQKGIKCLFSGAWHTFMFRAF